MKWQTQFRPGDLVRDKKTSDEAVIIRAQAIWRNQYGIVHRKGSEYKKPKEVYVGGHYGCESKTRYGSLNGYWYKDSQLELVKKGVLH